MSTDKLREKFSKYPTFMLEQCENYTRELKMLPTSVIFTDNSYNHRIITTDDVRVGECSELAAKIRKDGLTHPIGVQPLEESVAGSQDGFDFFQIHGFRRKFSVEHILGQKEILAWVNYGMDRFEAKIMNGVENLLQKTLNPLEEARLVVQVMAEGHLSALEAAEKLGKKRNTRWIQERLHISYLPDEVQNMIAVGSVPLYAVWSLVRMDSDAKKISAAKEFEKAHYAGGGRNRKSIVFGESATRRLNRIRTKGEITEMQVMLQMEFDLSDWAWPLAWAKGDIDDVRFQEEIYREIERRAEEGK